MKQATNAQIREFCGHNGAERTVRVKRNGEVWAHGSAIDTDRSKDFWHYVGEVSQFVADSDGNVDVVQT